MDFLSATTIVMGSAIVAVYFAKKLGFGSVLGYIIAGIVIGPEGLQFVDNAESVLHFSEIGVVLLLFIIGLELRPKRLWDLKRSIFGFGGLQLIVTTTILGLIAFVFLESIPTAIVVGLALSLSSTAFALQLLDERKSVNKPHGKVSLHILLFQDLAAIPIIALIPLASIDQDSAGRSLLLDSSIMVGVLIAYVLLGRTLLKPLLRAIAAVRTREIFIAASLLMVLGSALVMQSVGLSMALGAFVAGVLVADSEYRHQLESDIEPFKQLLLGLFFIAVGMTANLQLLVDIPLTVFTVGFTLVVCKAGLLILIGRLGRLRMSEAIPLGLCLSQGGEFGFIVFSMATKSGLMLEETNEVLTLAITLSMILTPLILIIFDKAIHKHSSQNMKPEHDVIDDTKSKVIIGGVGRFGQVIVRMLRAQGINFTAIDDDAEHVNFVRKLGNSVYYGDASNTKLLDTVGMDSAQVFVLAIDDVETSIQVAKIIKRSFPGLKLYARARTRMHEMRLRELGADFIIRETLHSSLFLSEKLLVELGLDKEKAKYCKDKFYQHDLDIIDRQYEHRHDQENLIRTTRESEEFISELFLDKK